MNSKLHAVYRCLGSRPAEVPDSGPAHIDYIGARVLLCAFPPAKHRVADRGQDADWSRNAQRRRDCSMCFLAQGPLGSDLARRGPLPPQDREPLCPPQ